MLYAFQYSTLSTVDLTLLGDFLAIGFAIAVVVALLVLILRLLRSVVQSMAGMLSWSIAVAAIVFLFFRLLRFFA